MTNKKLLVISLVMVLMAGFAFAQNVNVGADMTITGTVGEVRKVTLPGDVNFNLTGDGVNGVVAIGDMTIFSNVDYSVSVASGNGFSLTSTATGQSLSYSLDVNGTVANANDTVVATSGVRTPGTGDVYPMSVVYVQADADILDPGTDYSDTLTFTIAAP